VEIINLEEVIQYKVEMIIKVTMIIKDRILPLLLEVLSIISLKMELIAHSLL
jgi:hypothetical protein